MFVNKKKSRDEVFKDAALIKFVTSDVYFIYLFIYLFCIKTCTAIRLSVLSTVEIYLH